MTQLRASSQPLPALSRRSACAAVSLGLLLGCASPQPVTPVPRGQSVQLVFFRSPTDSPARIDNLSLGPAAGAGAGGGAVAGGLYGLSCGPFAILCVPAGALVGALAGWGGGAVVGLTGQLSEAQATQLRDRLVRVQQTHDLLAELRDNVARRTSPFWDLSNDKPSYVLTVELKGIELTSKRDLQIGMVVQVRVSLRRSDPAATWSLADKLYRFAPESSVLAAWLDERSDFLDTMFSSCSQQLAAQIAADFTHD